MQETEYRVQNIKEIYFIYVKPLEVSDFRGHLNLGIFNVKVYQQEQVDGVP